MEIKSLVRDAAKVHGALRELDDGKLVALKPLKILVPARYEERGLAEIGLETYICGMYCMVVEDKFYAVSSVCAMLRIEPFSTMTIKINGEEYFEFSFRAGDVVFHSTSLVKVDVLVYRLYDEFISKGNIPWYFGYEDMGRLFDTAKHHAGANVGENAEITELIVSFIARDKADKTKYYRTQVESLSYLKTNPPVFIPLKSVIYAATNTVNKLAGSYFSEGVSSALVYPAERTERIEELLRT
jgi:hypothetical protein